MNAFGIIDFWHMMDVKAWPLACVFQYIELGQPKFPIITCICAVCIPDPEVPALHEGTCLWNSLWSLPPTCSISIFFIFFLLMCGANHKWIDLATPRLLLLAWTEWQMQFGHQPKGTWKETVPKSTSLTSIAMLKDLLAYHLFSHYSSLICGYMLRL